jgi:hypothetical protein
MTFPPFHDVRERHLVVLRQVLHQTTRPCLDLAAFPSLPTQRPLDELSGEFRALRLIGPCRISPECLGFGLR